jgi:hypothetical protein
MTIFLITEIEKGGCVHGIRPTIQDLDYWLNSGYKHVCHHTNGLITLSKISIGKTWEHCNYLPINKNHKMDRKDIIISCFKSDLAKLMWEYNAYIFAGICETDCEPMSAIIKIDGQDVRVVLGDSINKNL